MRRAAAVVSLLMAITLQDAVSAQNPWHVSAPAPAGFDRNRGQRDTREHLDKLIALDTQNPPGNMSTGGTDGSRLRAQGIPTYGILPLPLPKEDELRMHGDDERVPIPALGWASEYLYRVLTLTGETR